MAKTGSGGNAIPNEAHQSQCTPAFAALPSLTSRLMAEVSLTLQRPPSLPLRTSSASMDTGASKADSTARKLRKAARRAHTASGGRDDGRGDTPKLYVRGQGFIFRR